MNERFYYPLLLHLFIVHFTYKTRMSLFEFYIASNNVLKIIHVCKTYGCDIHIVVALGCFRTMYKCTLSVERIKSEIYRIDLFYITARKKISYCKDILMHRHFFSLTLSWDNYSKTCKRLFLSKSTFAFSNCLKNTEIKICLFQ